MSVVLVMKYVAKNLFMKIKVRLYKLLISL